MADEVRVTWPSPVFDERGETLGPRDAVCILTHDPKFDVPAVQGALATRVGYIGVMGSRTTHERRLERLAEAGITSNHDLERLMSPIGLDLELEHQKRPLFRFVRKLLRIAPVELPLACAPAQVRFTPEISLM